jgi:superfamily II DNA/RNA helicase
MHGQMDKSKRQLIISDFAQGSTKFLITTDMIVYGIEDISVSLIINYELPINEESYIYRVGRVGKLGKKTIVVNLVSPDELGFLDVIEDQLGT